MRPLKSKKKRHIKKRVKKRRMFIWSDKVKSSGVHITQELLQRTWDAMKRNSGL